MPACLRTFVWLGTVASLLTACGGSGETGGETHWLLACSIDEACGPSATCECGVCTKRCTDSTECTEAGELGSCADPSSDGPTELCGVAPPQGLCLPECLSDTDCERFGAGFACRDSHCVEVNLGVTCMNDGDCPAASSCNAGGCTCDPQPTCVSPQDLRCTPTGDPRLNCLDCECVGEPPTDDLTWFTTCGDPVCAGHRPSGLPECSTQTEGNACSSEGAQCDLVNACNSNLVCARTDPKLAPGGCPISRRRYKRDIEYLSPDDLNAALEELTSLPLARYRYREGGNREHLGFILEDVEPSVAVDAPRDRVDLYSYTSLAVAALQAQARRIEALEAEVQALRSTTANADTGREALIPWCEN